jgi:hypothetical protein
MPATEADFEAFQTHLLGLRLIGWEAHHNAVVQRFPNPTDREALAEWASAGIRQSRVRDLTPVDRDVLINKIDSMNYRNDYAQSVLVDWLERDVKPWIPIGKDQIAHYRLVPGAYCLMAHKDDYNTPHQILCENVLGVNTNIAPRKPARDRSQQQNMPEISTASNETDNGKGGFVFHQLGTLEYFAGARSQTTSMDKLGRSAWLSTGFCVVVRFGSAGQAKGIYLIYDMFPENVDGDRVEIESGNTWGRLVPDAALQFSCAKVGATLRELQPGSDGFKALTLTELIGHPVELIRAARSSNGGIIRVTVAEDIR